MVDNISVDERCDKTGGIFGSLDFFFFVFFLFFFVFFFARYIYYVDMVVFLKHCNRTS